MKIAIEVDQAGQLHVTGDAILANKIATLGMLELAKQAVAAGPAPQPAIEVPNKTVAGRLVGSNGAHR